jgi:hypothetical protein
MHLFPKALSPAQIERRKKIQAGGRKHYIFYRGILTWGMPVFALTTLLKWYDKYGWHVPPRRGDLYFDVLLGLVLWSAGGYIFGAIMWKQIFEKSPSED